MRRPFSPSTSAIRVSPTETPSSPRTASPDLLPSATVVPPFERGKVRLRGPRSAIRGAAVQAGESTPCGAFDSPVPRSQAAQPDGKPAVSADHSDADIRFAGYRL